jgi:putative hemolysin
LLLDLTIIAARSSLIQLSHGRLLAMREQMGEKVGSVLKILPSIQKARTGLNLLLMLVRFGLSGLLLAFLLAQEIAGPARWATISLLIAALILFWLEWMVERAISHNPELWAIRLHGFIRACMLVMAIPLLPLNMNSDSGNGTDIMLSTVTEDELKSMVDAGEEDGVLEQGERQMIYSIFELGDTVAREIMVPRIDMLALDVRTPLVEAVDAMLASGHSRVPVYEGSVDNTIGLLFTKELLRAWRENLHPETLHGLLRSAFFVPEAKKVDELLTEMQAQHNHMAVVIDEYGGVAGLVTLEDIVEEILGEILDEYDVAEEEPYQELPDGGYLFLGKIPLDDFNDVFGAKLPSDEADTLGGYIYHELGHVPEVGEQVITGEVVLTVEQVTGRRIKKVSAHIWSPEMNNDEEGSSRADE